MDARRYDRNADQLAQIYWHYARLQKENNHPQIADMMRLVQECLQINDDLGQMAEKGLI